MNPYDERNQQHGDPRNGPQFWNGRLNQPDYSQADRQYETLGGTPRWEWHQLQDFYAIEQMEDARRRNGHVPPASGNSSTPESGHAENDFDELTDADDERRERTPPSYSLEEATKLYSEYESFVAQAIVASNNEDLTATEIEDWLDELSRKHRVCFPYSIVRILKTCRLQDADMWTEARLKTLYQYSLAANRRFAGLARLRYGSEEFGNNPTRWNSEPPGRPNWPNPPKAVVECETNRLPSPPLPEPGVIGPALTIMFYVAFIVGGILWMVYTFMSL